MIKEFDIVPNQPRLRVLSNVIYSHAYMPLKDEYIDLDMKLVVPDPVNQNIPEKRFPVQPLPAIVWIPGGGWGNYDNAASLPDLCYIARHGYIIADIRCRNHFEARFPASVEDAKTAVRFLRAHAQQYGIDPEHIAVGGNSSGGHEASLVGVNDGRFITDEWGGYSSEVCCCLDYYGVTEMVQHMKKYPEFPFKPHFPGSPPPGFPEQAFPELFYELDTPEGRMAGFELTKNPERTDELNPIKHINPRTAPFIIQHGDADEQVFTEESYSFYNALQKAGIEAELDIFHNAMHGTAEFSSDEALDMVIAFLDKHTKKKIMPQA